MTEIVEYLGGIAGLIFLPILVLGILITILYGCFVFLRDASEHVGEQGRDRERRQISYRHFLGTFVGAGIPERVLHQIYGVLWRDVLWAVKLEVGAETPLTDIYSPKWVDAGKVQSIYSELLTRCGVIGTAGSEFDPTTLGELANSINAARSSKPHAPDQLLVRASRSPEADLLRPTRAGTESHTRLLLRVPGEGNEEA